VEGALGQHSRTIRQPTEGTQTPLAAKFAGASSMPDALVTGPQSGGPSLAPEFELGAWA
jgi:hypothetical protein